MTVKVCEPVTLVEPVISPVAELIERPGGSPVAEKLPIPENGTVYDMEVSFFAKIFVPISSFKLGGPTKLSKFK